MQKIITFLLLIFTTIPYYFNAYPELIKRDEILSLKTSIIIPCVPKHAPLLKELLRAYAQQTIIPDEVIVALSEYEYVSQQIITELAAYPWPFVFHLIKRSEKYSAGSNRNAATAYATGDIIMAQDADDLPHPQRVECIKYMFEHYVVEHLLHTYISDEMSFTSYDVHNLKAYPRTRYRFTNAPVHFGHVCVLQKVAQKVPWPEYFEPGEDMQFNRSVGKNFRHTVILNADLIAYRKTLSSWH